MNVWHRWLSLLLVAPACCVAGRTRVHTPAGKREAGSLAVGDEVWSVDLASGRLVTARVTQIRRAIRECLVLNFADGSLTCTPDHPIYAPDRGAYRPASAWVTGDARTLLAWADDGAREVPLRDSALFAGLHEVVDLTVDAAPHNFIAAGVVVHNKSNNEPFVFFREGGPPFVLAAGESREFRIRACVEGADPTDTVLEVLARAKQENAPTAGGEPMQVEVYFVDEERFITVPTGQFGIISGEPAAPCSVGMTVAFERVDTHDDGSLDVTWHVESFGDPPEGAADTQHPVEFEE